VVRRSDPAPSRGVLSDLWCYLFRRPALPTLVRIGIDESREHYLQRIVERIGMRADDYRILNIHRIGIRAPAEVVFDALLGWGPNAAFWPNALARVERLGGSLERVRVHYLGGKRRRPLFDLYAIRIRSEPDAPERNRARYLLYACGGGYPIGFLCLYLRDRIPERGEAEPTQLFFVVAFNFFGRKDWPRLHPIQRLWQVVHDRVTGNVLNRIKVLCENRKEGREPGRQREVAPVPGAPRPA